MSLPAGQKRHAATAARILRSISHPLRLLIVCLLLDREHFVQEILEKVGTTKGNVSQHLRLLELKGLVRARRDGNRIYYSIGDPALGTLIRCMKDLYCRDLKIGPGPS